MGLLPQRAVGALVACALVGAAGESSVVGILSRAAPAGDPVASIPVGTEDGSVSGWVQVRRRRL